MGWNTEDTGKHDVYVKYFMGFEEYKINEINLYPNPVRKNGLLYFDSIIDEIQIYELTGKMVYESKISIISPLPVADFPTGIYLINLRKGNRKLQLKILIED